MKHLTMITLAMITSLAVMAQQPTRFEDSKGNIHLCGPFDLSTLETDTLYNGWYQESYNDYDPELTDASWKTKLNDVQVNIFMGTWCGDTQHWLPRFVKLWDALGLDRSQLSFTALYNSSVEGKYKQGPAGEEKGMDVHRVPVFIFKREGKEIGRIVEYPVTDLKTDVAQIALGVPTAPSYPAAAYLQKLYKDEPIDSIKANINTYFRELWHKSGRSSELNTLGYVYMAAEEMDKALMTFEFNMHLNRYVPYVYDSYGEALAKAGKTEESIAIYKRLLELDPKNEDAQKEVTRLEEQLALADSN